MQQQGERRGWGRVREFPEEESGSKLEERDVGAVKEVDGMRDVLVTIEGGAGEGAATVSFSLLTGVVGAVVDDDMAAGSARARALNRGRSRLTG